MRHVNVIWTCDEMWCPRQTYRYCEDDQQIHFGTIVSSVRRNSSQFGPTVIQTGPVPSGYYWKHLRKSRNQDNLLSSAPSHPGRHFSLGLLTPPNLRWRYDNNQTDDFLLIYGRRSISTFEVYTGDSNIVVCDVTNRYINYYKLVLLHRNTMTFWFLASKLCGTSLTTRMWANAQRDARPSECRWCPVFNAANFGWRLADAHYSSAVQ